MSRVLVTRPADDGRTSAALRGAGYEVVTVPTIAVEALGFEPPRLRDYDWVVVTSSRGVAALLDISKPPRWAAVGATTAAALRERGVEPDFIPAEATGEALAESLPGIKGRRVLLPRAHRAAPDLPRVLRRRGARVTELATYATVIAPPSSRGALAAALADGIDVLVFASQSAVQGYVELGGPASIPAVTIGPRTTEATEEAGFPKTCMASDPSPAAILVAVDQVTGRRR